MWNKLLSRKSRISDDQESVDKLYIPKEVHKIKLKRGETLVWGLDLDQYKNLSSNQIESVVNAIKSGLQRVFPKNRVIVTIGKTEISTVQTAEE